jgi:hypothetical protein
MRRLLPALALALALATAGACDPPPLEQATLDAGDVAAAADVAAATDEALAADLIYLREEEKLARDVYTTLYASSRLTPFANISGSEQAHTDQVARLLALMGIPDPVVDDTVGAFVNGDLARLYAELVAAGQPSAVAALTVGATIEDLDIFDIRAMMARTDDPAALALYANLQCGSRGHLRVFVSQLTSRGASYTARFMTQAEVDAIVEGPAESCGAAAANTGEPGTGGSSGSGSGSGGSGSGGSGSGSGGSGGPGGSAGGGGGPGR